MSLSVSEMMLFIMPSGPVFRNTLVRINIRWLFHISLNHQVWIMGPRPMSCLVEIQIPTTVMTLLYSIFRKSSPVNFRVKKDWSVERNMVIWDERRSTHWIWIWSIERTVAVWNERKFVHRIWIIYTVITFMVFILVLLWSRISLVCRFHSTEGILFWWYMPVQIFFWHNAIIWKVYLIYKSNWF